MILHQPRLETSEDSVPSTGINKVIKSFNRNTTWVAAGLLGSVVSAAMVVAFQERNAQADDLTQEAKQTKGDLLPGTDFVPITKGVGSNEKSTSETTAGQAAIDQHAFTPQINQPEVQLDETPTQPPDSARVIYTKTSKVRLRSAHPRYVDVKARLIALWHRSLRPEKARGWRMFANSNKTRKEKISYTSMTSH